MLNFALFGQIKSRVMLWGLVTREVKGWNGNGQIKSTVGQPSVLGISSKILRCI